LEQSWKPKRGDQIIRRPRQSELTPIEIPFVRPRISRGFVSSPLTPIVVFALLIFAGTILLFLPISTTTNQSPHILKAFFTATSAVTLTGLTVVDTESYWSTTGQAILMILIFLGGLGMITSAVVLYSIFLGNRSATLTNSIQFSRSMGALRPRGTIRKIARNIILVTVAIQLVGFLTIFANEIIQNPSANLLDTIWNSLFHTISAFNNSGFDIDPGQHALVFGSYGYLSTTIIAILIITGSIGYFTLSDIARNKLRPSRWSLNTKLILCTSAILTLLGAATLFAGEYNNPDTLGSMKLHEKITAALFNAISGRTAGFETFDFSQLEQQTSLWYILLMFIGGAAGSTAGGIKVTTVAILVAAVFTSLSNRSNIVAFRREIPSASVNLALSVSLLSLGAVAISALILTSLGGSSVGDAEPAPFLAILFDSVSAYSTNGLSAGGLTNIGSWGELVVVITMFVGRLGPLTLALVLFRREPNELYRYPSEEVTIG
jgi:trk system potassium uptake protein TrkH